MTPLYKTDCLLNIALNSSSVQEKFVTNSTINRLLIEDRAVHDWYRFVLSFPAHLVREYLCQWGVEPGQCVLDPFAGTGSTLVEAKKRQIRSIGIEANPTVHFAATTKLDWSPNPRDLTAHAESVAIAATRLLECHKNTDFLTLPDKEMDLLLSNSVSPLPLHKVLALRHALCENRNPHFDGHERLALAKTAVGTASNLRFGPEVGVSTKKKTDAKVIEAWLANIKEIANDLCTVSTIPSSESTVIFGDARAPRVGIEPCSIDAVFTSPPYPNEKDYSRTTRLEMVLLGFAEDKGQLQNIKRGLLRSNTRNVYKGDDDDLFVCHFPVVQQIAEDIESRRIALGKNSGFERLYAKVTKLYFGGMARHLAELRPLLRHGAYLGYVVGDQASYLRVMIRTGAILGEIAQSLGYELIRIDLFRTRLSTTTKEMMREEVVVLRWNG